MPNIKYYLHNKHKYEIIEVTEDMLDENRNLKFDSNVYILSWETETNA